MLETLKSQTLADGVENSLLEYIRGNNLQIGEVLPKEKDLAESLGVSRHIVREGVSRLKALGLIESRKKRGMVIKCPSIFTGLCKLAENNLFPAEDREEFMELRIALELGMTDFIFARKTPEKIANLRKVSGIAASSIQSTETEIDFHTTLMDFAENRTVNQFRNILVKAFENDSRLNPSLRTPTHDEICDVLEYGTVEAFREIMRKHFQPYQGIISNSRH